MYMLCLWAVLSSVELQVFTRGWGWSVWFCTPATYQSISRCLRGCGCWSFNSCMSAVVIPLNLLYSVNLLVVFQASCPLSSSFLLPRYPLKLLPGLLSLTRPACKNLSDFIFHDQRLQGSTLSLILQPNLPCNALTSIPHRLTPPYSVPFFHAPN